MRRIKLLSVVILLFFTCCFPLFNAIIKSAKAEEGVNTSNWVEYNLYNATNTYNVNSSCFDSNGNFITTNDNDRITNKIQYNISYNMSQTNTKNK